MIIILLVLLLIFIIFSSNLCFQWLSWDENRQYNPVPSWDDWRKEAEMWSNECRRRRGSQRSTYEPHPMSIDWVSANKLPEIQSCTPPQEDRTAKYWYWYLRDVSTQIDWYWGADCNGTSPTLTSLIVTEISWHKVLRWWWYRTGGDTITDRLWIRRTWYVCYISLQYNVKYYFEWRIKHHAKISMSWSSVKSRKAAVEWHGYFSRRREATGFYRQYCCLYDAGVVTMPCQARRTKEEEEVVVVGQTPLSSGRPRTLASVWYAVPIRSRAVPMACSQSRVKKLEDCMLSTGTYVRRLGSVPPLISLMFVRSARFDLLWLLLPLKHPNVVSIASTTTTRT